MYSAFVDIAVVIGVLVVVAVAVFAKVRFKVKQIVAEIPNSIDLAGDEQALVEAQQVAYEKVVSDQTAELQFSTYSILGNAGVPFARIFLSGSAISAVAADVHGDFIFEGLPPGTFVVAPYATGSLFHPAFQIVEIVNADATGIDFLDPVSFQDCRNYGNFPNNSTNVNGTLTYTVQQFESRAAGAPKDSRAAGAPVACGTYPQNSRVSL